MSAKKIRGYRLSEEAFQAIKGIAGKAGISEAAVIEQWALDGNCRGDKTEVTEKKSGAAREVTVEQDVPDELPPVVKKKVAPKLPAVIRGSELEKRPVRTLGDDGRIYINGVAQVTDLRAERLARANTGPLLRPGQRK